VNLHERDHFEMVVDAGVELDADVPADEDAEDAEDAEDDEDGEDAEDDVGADDADDDRGDDFPLDDVEAGDDVVSQRSDKFLHYGMWIVRRSLEKTFGTSRELREPNSESF